MKSIILLFVCFLPKGPVEALDFRECVKTLTDGCSVPLGISWPYKKNFMPACLRHDVCYSCVSISISFVKICFKTVHSRAVVIVKHYSGHISKVPT